VLQHSAVVISAIIAAVRVRLQASSQAPSFLVLPVLACAPAELAGDRSDDAAAWQRARAHVSPAQANTSCSCGLRHAARRRTTVCRAISESQTGGALILPDEPGVESSFAHARLPVYAASCHCGCRVNGWGVRSV